MSKIWKVHRGHSYTTKDGVNVHCSIQLFDIGIYAILNNNPAAQMTMLPHQLEKTEKNLIKQSEEGFITNLEFGEELCILDESGFFREVEPPFKILIKKNKKYKAEFLNDEYIILQVISIDKKDVIEDSEVTFKVIEASSKNYVKESYKTEDGVYTAPISVFQKSVNTTPYE